MKKEVKVRDLSMSEPYPSFSSQALASYLGNVRQYRCEMSPEWMMMETGTVINI